MRTGLTYFENCHFIFLQEVFPYFRDKMICNLVVVLHCNAAFRM